MKINTLVILAALFCAATTNAAEIGNDSSGDRYEVDGKTKGLKVSWQGGSLLVKGVVGDKGEVTRDLVGFNGKKALHYENLATATPFEAYLTVKRSDAGLVVDCIYGNIRNNQNGVLINKAVCGLNKKLVANYEDLIYEYSDAWKSSANFAALAPLMEDPATPVRVEEAKIRDLTIVRIYKSQDDLVSTLPTTIVERNSHEHSFGSSTVFTVFDASDLTVPVHIDIASKNLEESFERLDYERLKVVIN
ncbi:hypothetical protein [Pseudomonas fluorescens]|uniref:hypothetical protein n=1 Tax=Pseudomonas fluorescens TaxID=294 RepID=UPI003CFE6FF2